MVYFKQTCVLDRMMGSKSGETGRSQTAESTLVQFYIIAHSAKDQRVSHSELKTCLGRVAKWSSLPSSLPSYLDTTHQEGRVTDTEHRVEGVKGEAVERVMEWEVGVIRHNLLHIEQIDNKVLLYSMGNCTQFFQWKKIF